MSLGNESPLDAVEVVWQFVRQQFEPALFLGLRFSISLLTVLTGSDGF